MTEGRKGKGDLISERDSGDGRGRTRMNSTRPRPAADGVAATEESVTWFGTQAVWQYAVRVRTWLCTARMESKLVA